MSAEKPFSLKDAVEKIIESEYPKKRLTQNPVSNPMQEWNLTSLKSVLDYQDDLAVESPHPESGKEIWSPKDYKKVPFINLPKSCQQVLKAQFNQNREKKRVIRESRDKKKMKKANKNLNEKLKKKSPRKFPRKKRPRSASKSPKSPKSPRKKSPRKVKKVPQDGKKKNLAEFLGVPGDDRICRRRCSSMSENTFSSSQKKRRRRALSFDGYCELNQRK